MVIARVLKQLDYNVSVAVVKFSNNYSDDCLINKKRLEKMGLVIDEIEEPSDLIRLESGPSTIIIDAIFGTGLSRIPSGFSGKAIDRINELDGMVVSIDTPSGMFCDIAPPNTHKEIVRADVTLSFECPKGAFLMPEAGSFCGEIEVLGIGLSSKYLEKINEEFNYIMEDDISERIEEREKFTHKGNYGHALIIAGSYGKTGAAILSAKACLSSGVGLLSLHVPRCSHDIIQTAVPEAMVDVNEGEFKLRGDVISEKEVLAVGPGIGQDNDTIEFMEKLLRSREKPMVIDADALNIIAKNKGLLTQIPPHSILTPHPKEFERLVGKWNTNSEKLDKLKELASANNVYVVLKGAHTIIAKPDSVLLFNSTGNPGMATAGSGDVLTGIICSLLAQGYSEEDACTIAVYIHGLSGDLALDYIAEESLLAGDIIEFISDAFEYLK
jgi:NAD(P)H-hydrate epimerase